MSILKINKYLFLGISIFFFQNLSSQSFTVSGFVFDKSNNEVIVGAYIYCPQTGTGTVTNRYGYYAITIPYGIKNLMYIHEDFITKMDTTKINKNKSQNVYLRNSNIYPNDFDPFKKKKKNEDDSLSDKQIDEFKNNKETEQRIINAIERNEKIIDILETGFIEVPGFQVYNAPQLIGEIDVVRNLKLLPGVLPSSELSNGLNIRGGSADQNLFLLDGITLYNQSHMFGLGSTINADAVKSIELQKGGFSSRNGGRLSAITDIVTKEGDANGVNGIQSNSPFILRLSVNGPLSNKTTFQVSGRRSYLDWLLSPFSDDDGGAKYVLHDINLKVAHTINSKNKLVFSFFNSRDRIYFKTVENQSTTGSSRRDESVLDLKYGSTIGQVRLNKVHSNKLFASYVAAYSQYKLSFLISNKFRIDSVGGSINSSLEFLLLNQVRDFIANADYDYYYNKTNTFHFGINTSHRFFKPAQLSFTTNNNGAVRSRIFGENDKAQSQEIATYFDDEITISDKLKISIGSRLVHYLYFSQKARIFLEPRLIFNYKVNHEYAIKGSITRMNQHIHLIADNNSQGFDGTLTENWVPATNNLGSQTATQFTLGVSKPLKENLEIHLDGYYKRLQNLYVFKEGQSGDILYTEGWENTIAIANGNCYGVEAFLHKRKGDMNGWISYTFSVANRQSPSINLGKKYYFDFDRRHYVNVVNQINLSERFVFSSNIVFSTGNVQSLPTSKYVNQEGTLLYEYSQRNNYRMTNTFRVDVGFKILKNRSWFEESGYNISVYNVFARKNPSYIQIREEDGKTKAYQQTLLAFIPGISYYVKF